MKFISKTYLKYTDKKGKQHKVKAVWIPKGMRVQLDNKHLGLKMLGDGTIHTKAAGGMMGMPVEMTSSVYSMPSGLMLETRYFGREDKDLLVRIEMTPGFESAFNMQDKSLLKSELQKLGIMRADMVKRPMY